MKVVNSPVEGNGKKKALLDDAPSSNVYSQLQKLTAQNPVCEYFSSHFPCFADGQSRKKCKTCIPSHLPSCNRERISFAFCETKSQLQKLTAQNPVCEYFSSHFPCFAVVQNMHSFTSSFLQLGKNLFCILCETESAAKAEMSEKGLKLRHYWNRIDWTLTNCFSTKTFHIFCILRWNWPHLLLSYHSTTTIFTSFGLPSSRLLNILNFQSHRTCRTSSIHPPIHPSIHPALPFEHHHLLFQCIHIKPSPKYP